MFLAFFRHYSCLRQRKNGSLFLLDNSMLIQPFLYLVPEIILRNVIIKQYPLIHVAGLYLPGPVQCSMQNCSIVRSIQYRRAQVSVQHRMESCSTAQKGSCSTYSVNKKVRKYYTHYRKVPCSTIAQNAPVLRSVQNDAQFYI